MKLNPKKGNGGHITAYLTVIGSKEARDAGFIREDGTSRILKKTVDPENQTITISIDWTAENTRTD